MSLMCLESKVQKQQRLTDELVGRVVVDLVLLSVGRVNLLGPPGKDAEGFPVK